MVEFLRLIVEICLHEFFQYMRVDVCQAGGDRAALRAIERGDKLADYPLGPDEICMFGLQVLLTHRLLRDMTEPYRTLVKQDDQAGGTGGLDLCTLILIQS